MGWFALFNRESPQYMQVLATMIKVPALFLLTLLVTLPSLYVFNALAGSRLSGVALLRLLVASLAVTLAVLASFGPIVAFFSVTTSSYPFMLLLNVLLMAVAGVLGLGFLLQTMHRLTLPSSLPLAKRLPKSDAPAPTESITVSDPRPYAEPVTTTEHMPNVESETTAEQPVSALEPVGWQGHNVRAVFACWVVVFGLVGAQMSWVLRPFVGAPGMPFEWLRARESNFFVAVQRTLIELLQ